MYCGFICICGIQMFLDFLGEETIDLNFKLTIIFSIVQYGDLRLNKKTNINENIFFQNQ